MNDTIRNFCEMSVTAGSRADYVQGGGGNTSAKLDSNRMAIKASGFRLDEIKTDNAYVVVDYKNIREYYDNADITRDHDFEKESVDFCKTNIIPQQGLPQLRPSVEAGFHSILDKYVLHTHSVWANIISCSKNAKELMEKIFDGFETGCIFIPYINPGFCLTLKIKTAREEYEAKNGTKPCCIFMENHGFIATSEDYREAIRLHDKADKAIQKYFKLTEPYPVIELEKIDESTYMSKTTLVKEFFKDGKDPEAVIKDFILYPDQIVYLNGSLGSKLTATADGIIYSGCTANEAKSLEETLTAYMFVLKNIHTLNLELKTMSDTEVDYILNWESEAYRKKLLEQAKL